MLSGPGTDERTYSPFGLADPTGGSSGITVGFGHGHDADEGFGRLHHDAPVTLLPYQSVPRVPPIRAQARRARRARIWEGPQARRQRSCRAPARVGITTSGFAPSGGFFDGWPSPYTEIVTGAYTAAWVGVAIYAVIDALGGMSAGAAAGTALPTAATTATSSAAAAGLLAGHDGWVAAKGVSSIVVGVISGATILGQGNRNLPTPAVPARSPTPGQAPTGSAKGQSGEGGAGARLPNSMGSRASRSRALQSRINFVQGPDERARLR